MHGQHLVDVLDTLRLARDLACAAYDLGIGALSDQQALGLVREPNRNSNED